METSEVIYSCGLSVFSIILMFLIAYLQIRVNKSQLRQWCMMILTCSIITNISMMFQIININQNLEIWYEAFSIIGIAFMPICCFLAVTYFFKK